MLWDRDIVTMVETKVIPISETMLILLPKHTIWKLS